MRSVFVQEGSGANGRTARGDPARIAGSRIGGTESRRRRMARPGQWPEPKQFSTTKSTKNTKSRNGGGLPVYRDDSIPGVFLRVLRDLRGFSFEPRMTRIARRKNLATEHTAQFMPGTKGSRKNFWNSQHEILCAARNPCGFVTRMKRIQEPLEACARLGALLRSVI